MHRTYNADVYLVARERRRLTGDAHRVLHWQVPHKVEISQLVANVLNALGLDTAQKYSHT